LRWRSASGGGGAGRGSKKQKSKRGDEGKIEEVEIEEEKR
jgi:hypothetical protein